MTIHHAGFAFLSETVKQCGSWFTKTIDLMCLSYYYINTYCTTFWTASALYVKRLLHNKSFIIMGTLSAFPSIHYTIILSITLRFLNKTTLGQILDLENFLFQQSIASSSSYYKLLWCIKYVSKQQKSVQYITRLEKYGRIQSEHKGTLLQK